MLRDKLRQIQDIAFLLVTAEIAVVLNVAMFNWVFDLGWNLWSFGKYLLTINIMLATIYVWAWIMVLYFDAQLEAQGKTKEELEREREEKRKEKERKRKERERKRAEKDRQAAIAKQQTITTEEGKPPKTTEEN